MAEPKIEDYLIKVQDIADGNMLEIFNTRLQQAAKDICERDQADGVRKVQLVIELDPKDTHVEIRFQTSLQVPKDPKGIGIGFVEAGRLVKTTGLENIMKPRKLPVNGGEE